MKLELLTNSTVVDDAESNEPDCDEAEDQLEENKKRKPEK
jgi:hypothetical protein